MNSADETETNEPYIFDHAAQVVPNIGEAIAWYKETIPGTQVLYEDATWGLIACGGAKLAFVVKDEHPGHLAWRVSDAELTRLAAQNHKEIKPHRDKTRSFYLTGPGNQAIEIIAIAGSDYEKKLNDAGLL